MFDEDEFVSSSDLEKCSIPSVSQQWMLCSEWVPSEWESKQLIKHHNNPFIVYYCDVFIRLSFWRHPFTTEHPLLRHWWTGVVCIIVMFLSLSFWRHPFTTEHPLLRHWWTGVVWIIVMFWSDSHSDGTHSLQSIHCWDTDTFLQI